MYFNSTYLESILRAGEASSTTSDGGAGLANVAGGGPGLISCRSACPGRSGAWTLGGAKAERQGLQ